MSVQLVPVQSQLPARERNPVFCSSAGVKLCCGFLVLQGHLVHRLDTTDKNGTDKLTHTHGLKLQNSCGDTIITDRWLHFERNLMQKEAEYSHF